MAEEHSITGADATAAPDHPPITVADRGLHRRTKHAHGGDGQHLPILPRADCARER